jgi:predicted DNA-binding transcriptional regulator AlpA
MKALINNAIDPDAQVEPLLLSVGKLASLLNISINRVWELQASGQLGPQPVSLDGQPLWRRSEVKDWIDAGCPRRDRWLELATPEHTKSCTYSEDFSSVLWYGTRYDFNKTQALVIKFLWAEWEKGGLGLSEKTIAEKIESVDDHYRLRNTFRHHNGHMHPAWGTMIQSVNKGTFRLVGPEKIRIS